MLCQASDEKYKSEIHPYNLYCVGGDVKPCSINHPYLVNV